MEKTYTITVAGVQRELPICRVNDHMDIAGFVMIGDVELTVACAAELIKHLPEFDIMLTAEAKGIPLVAEMARQLGVPKYIVARKVAKLYMKDPISCTVQSITTKGVQTLYLDASDVVLMKGRRVLIVDDVISTGESLKTLEALVEKAGGKIAGRMAVLAEGEAAERNDIIYLEKLPLFFHNEK